MNISVVHSDFHTFPLLKRVALAIHRTSLCDLNVNDKTVANHLFYFCPSLFQMFAA